MTNESLTEFVDGMFAMIKIVLNKKNREYARIDALSNFKRAGQMQGSTPETALIGMMSKHIISVMDLVNDIDCGSMASDEMWNEKIVDNISYLILLRALIKDRQSICNNGGIDGKT